MFGLIPTDDAGRSGLLLRDRSYAEKAPVAGQFRMDAENGLILTTDYEMMSSLERFGSPAQSASAHQHGAGAVQRRLLLHGNPAVGRCSTPLPPPLQRQSLAPFVVSTFEQVLRQLLLRRHERGTGGHFYDRHQWML